MYRATLLFYVDVMAAPVVCYVAEMTLGLNWPSQSSSSSSWALSSRLACSAIGGISVTRKRPSVSSAG
jgi:hypothetical protein